MKDTIDAKAARELNMVRLTEPYTANEQWMLENAVKNLEAGGIKYALVRTHSGDTIELWRSRNGFLDTQSGIAATKKPEFGVRSI